MILQVFFKNGCILLKAIFYGIGLLMWFVPLSQLNECFFLKMIYLFKPKSKIQKSLKDEI
jgi:hypothetical protein